MLIKEYEIEDEGVGGTYKNLLRHGWSPCRLQYRC